MLLNNWGGILCIIAKVVNIISEMRKGYVLNVNWKLILIIYIGLTITKWLEENAGNIKEKKGRNNYEWINDK